MTCRNCGTEIADKAIVCYRCGTATTDPVRRPAAVRPRSRLLSTVGLVLLVLLALFLGQAGRTSPAYSQPLDIAAAVCLVAAVALLILRLRRRR